MKKYKVKLIKTYAFDFEVEANNRVEAEEKAKEYVDKIIPTIEGDKE